MIKNNTFLFAPIGLLLLLAMPHRTLPIQKSLLNRIKNEARDAFDGLHIPYTAINRISKNFIDSIPPIKEANRKFLKIAIDYCKNASKQEKAFIFNLFSPYEITIGGIILWTVPITGLIPEIDLRTSIHIAEKIISSKLQKETTTQSLLYYSSLFSALFILGKTTSYAHRVYLSGMKKANFFENKNSPKEIGAIFYLIERFITGKLHSKKARTIFGISINPEKLFSVDQHRFSIAINFKLLHWFITLTKNISLKAKNFLAPCYSSASQ